MSRMVDDEPPIKSHPANDAYRDNWDRIFGEPEKHEDIVCVDGTVWRTCEDASCPDFEHPEDLHSHKVEPRVEAAGNVTIVSECTTADPVDMQYSAAIVRDAVTGEVVKDRFGIACGVCGATDHERIEAFGGTLQGCPQVPDGYMVALPDTDEIKCTIKSYALHCNVCERTLDPGEDPDDHRYHAIIKLDKPVYYAHPLWFYGTEAERADVDEITRQLGSVLNPNSEEHETAYFARKAATGKGMDYFLEDVLPGCGACVFRADTDTLVSSGVVLEVNWFVAHGLPTYEITAEGLVPAIVDPARDMGIEESRRRCKK